jgi:hypothetical protein
VIDMEQRIWPERFTRIAAVVTVAGLYWKWRFAPLPLAFLVPIMLVSFSALVTGVGVMARSGDRACWTRPRFLPLRGRWLCYLVSVVTLVAGGGIIVWAFVGQLLASGFIKD